MIDAIAEALEAKADARTARQGIKQYGSLRGIRGVPMGDLARIIAAAWRTHRPRLPDRAEELDALFGQAHEDGLVAIGLLAAAWSDDPQRALDLGLSWGDRLDDIVTADALGWLVLGPVGLHTGEWPAIIDELAGHRRPEGRRAVVAMALAACPVVVEGPAAAALRAKVGGDGSRSERPGAERSEAEEAESRPTTGGGWARVQMVAEVQCGPVRQVLDRMVRDPHPAVRKALRRVVRAYAASAPEDAIAWADGVHGGLPRLLGDEIRRARRSPRD